MTVFNGEERRWDSKVGTCNKHCLLREEARVLFNLNYINYMPLIVVNLRNLLKCLKKLTSVFGCLATKFILDICIACVLFCFGNLKTNLHDTTLLTHRQNNM